MKSIDFVKSLNEHSPMAKDFIGIDVSPEFIKNMVDGYFPSKRKSDSYYTDPLLMLIDCYEADKIKIGMIDFYDRIKENKRYFVVGEVEVDLLVIDKASGIIKVMEDHIDHVLWECAINSSAFLDALTEASKFMVKCMTDDELYSNNEASHTVVDVCASLAGGNRFADFYKMLLGCE